MTRPGQGIDASRASSIGAGAIHAAAAGVHAENPTLVTAVRADRGGADPRRAAAPAPARAGRRRGDDRRQRRRRGRLGDHPDDRHLLDRRARARRVATVRRHRMRRARRARPPSPASSRWSATRRLSPRQPCAPGVALGALSVAAMMVGATNVHSHGETPTTPTRTTPSPPPAPPSAHVGRRPGEQRSHPHLRAGSQRSHALVRAETTDTPTTTEPSTAVAVATGLGPDGADRLLRRHRRQRRAAGAGRDTRRQHVA